MLNVKRPTARYASSLLAFVLLAACPIVTWFVVPTPGVRRLDAALHQAGERPVARVDVEVAQTDLPRDEIDERGVAWQDSLRPFKPWIIGAWLCGVGLLSLRLLCGAIGIWRWRRAVDVLPESLVPVVERLCFALSMKMPSVRVCRRVAEAVAVGLFKPMILLPAAWVAELPLDMLEAVLAHELAHVRRLDLWVNLLQRIVETLLFYGSSDSSARRCQRSGFSEA